MTKFDPEIVAKALAEKAAREAAIRSLAGYVPYTLELYPAKHHRLICQKLDRVIAGKSKRVIIAAPPGSAKSTYTSLGFAAYAAGKLPPGSNIIAASHTDEFSQTWGRRVRNLCSTPAHQRLFPNGAVSPDDRAASRWSTVGGTEYFGVGVGGSVTGRRADILLCDDLLRGRTDANSKKKRQEIKDWFFSDAYTRLKPGGSIVVIATRWHEDDLTGNLLDMMADGTGDQWEYLKFEALCEDVENDPLGREYGEQLWPEYWTKEFVEGIKNSGMLAADWASLYQQRPSPEDGNMIQRVWFNKYPRLQSKEMLKECEIWLSFDTAVKGSERSDPTVGLAVARHRNGNFYLLAELRIREEFVEMKKKVKEFREQIISEYGKIAGILIENKGNGEALISSLKSEINTPIIAMEPRALGDKEFRFDRCSPIFEAGQFFVPSDPVDLKWVDAYIDELVVFPASKNDDRVDATSQLLNYFGDKINRKRRMRPVVGLV